MCSCGRLRWHAGAVAAGVPWRLETNAHARRWLRCEKKPRCRGCEGCAAVAASGGRHHGQATGVAVADSTDRPAECRRRVNRPSFRVEILPQNRRHPARGRRGATSHRTGRCPGCSRRRRRRAVAGVHPGDAPHARRGSTRPGPEPGRCGTDWRWLRSARAQVGAFESQ